ncbi:MAG: hypothetical protein ACT4QC_16560 [Planctomycetaceae bacterium]
MSPIVLYLRKTTRRLAVTLAVCCALELYFAAFEGTKPNGRFPWGRYNETLAVAGVGAGRRFLTRRRPSPERQKRVRLTRGERRRLRDSRNERGGLNR